MERKIIHMEHTNKSLRESTKEPTYDINLVWGLDNISHLPIGSVIIDIEGDVWEIIEDPE